MQGRKKETRVTESPTENRTEKKTCHFPTGLNSHVGDKSDEICISGWGQARKCVLLVDQLRPSPVPHGFANKNKLSSLPAFATFFLARPTSPSQGPWIERAQSLAPSFSCGASLIMVAGSSALHNSPPVLCICFQTLVEALPCSALPFVGLLDSLTSCGEFFLALNRLCDKFRLRHRRTFCGSTFLSSL